MIDDDFLPDRLQLRALGLLLIDEQNAPLIPAIREASLYHQVFLGTKSVDECQSWLDELVEHGLVKIVETGSRAGDRVGEATTDVFLTPNGTYYTKSRPFLFAENSRTLTDDFPEQIVDAPWAIQAYYSLGDSENVLVDEKIKFDKDEQQYNNALDVLSSVFEALASDNEISAIDPVAIDEKLQELKLIRELLIKREGWRSKLIAISWGALGYIGTQFAERPVGALADEAWQAKQAII